METGALAGGMLGSDLLTVEASDAGRGCGVGARGVLTAGTDGSVCVTFVRGGATCWVTGFTMSISGCVARFATGAAGATLGSVWATGCATGCITWVAGGVICCTTDGSGWVVNGTDLVTVCTAGVTCWVTAGTGGASVLVTCWVMGCVGLVMVCVTVGDTLWIVCSTVCDVCFTCWVTICTVCSTGTGGVVAGRLTGTLVMGSVGKPGLLIVRVWVVAGLINGADTPGIKIGVAMKAVFESISPGGFGGGNGMMEMCGNGWCAAWGCGESQTINANTPPHSKSTIGRMTLRTR